MRVRIADVADAGAIAKVHVAAWRAGYRGLLSDELLDGLSVAERERRWKEILVAEDGGSFTLVAVDEPDEVVGFCAAAVPSRDDDAGEGTAEVAATYVDPGRWGSGIGTALLGAALDQLRNGYGEATLWVLAANRRARSFYRMLGFEPDGREDEPEWAEGLVVIRLRAELTGMTLRPLAAGDEVELRRILATPEVRRWWDAPDAGFPWTDEPDVVRYAIEIDGRVAGMIQYAEEADPKYRHASIDLFVDPAAHGRGHGTEAVRRVASHLIHGRGHHRITIDPAASNGAAIRAYEKVGFRPVGVMRRYERDADGEGWHDGLLMELLAGELGASPTGPRASGHGRGR